MNTIGSLKMQHDHYMIVFKSEGWVGGMVLGGEKTVVPPLIPKISD